MVSVGRALTLRRLYRGARRHGEGRSIERYGELSVVMDLSSVLRLVLGPQSDGLFHVEQLGGELEQMACSVPRGTLQLAWFRHVPAPALL